MTGRLDVAVFAGRLGQTFRIQFQDGSSLDLELAEVQDLGTRPTADGPLSTYSLRFRTPGEKRFTPQGTYRVEHAELEPLEIFLVPLGPDALGMRYEAIFN
ncbi:MAG: hypothetical protein ABW221_18075 [Vicinamibacteria bacterium]